MSPEGRSTPELIPIYGTRCLRGKEAHAMAGGQCRGLQSRLPAFLDIPSVTVDEFQRLMPAFEAAIQAPMGLCAPSIVSGCTSHSGTRWFNRDKLSCAKAHKAYTSSWRCITRTTTFASHMPAYANRCHSPCPPTAAARPSGGGRRRQPWQRA